MAGATVEVKCQRCKTPFMARVADRKRGWGKFCSKSCKAIKQEQRTGQCGAYHGRQREERYVDDEPTFQGVFADEDYYSGKD